ncbi:RNA-directed DNA polymerase, eukaryota [Tanacetum coccineum]
MKDFRGPLGSKKGMVGNHNLPKQHMAYKKKKTSTPVSNSFSALEEDNEKPIDELIDDTRKKMEALPKKAPRKTGIWSSRKADSPKRNVVFSLEMKVHYFDRDDMDFDDMRWAVKELKHMNVVSYLHRGWISQYFKRKIQAIPHGAYRITDGLHQRNSVSQELGVGPAAFSQPGFPNGAKLRLQMIMMCFGRNWDPRTKYNEHYRSDGSEAPPVPGTFVSLVENAIQDSQAYASSIFSVYPDIFVVNLYTTTGRLGLHQDHNENPNSLKRGLPVVSISIGSSTTVSSKLNASSLDNSFRRKARSGIEEMQLNSLAEISRMTTLVPCEDRYVWTLESDGVFSVASIRKEIDGNRFQDISLPTRWIKSVPIKVNIIAWKVKSNALPTRFNISRRGMDIDSIVCPICNAGVESTNHIFFQCVVVRQIMRKISSWWNIDYSDVNSYEEWRVWLVSIRIQSKLKGVLEGVYYGLWWYMWNFRNKLLFDKKIPEKALIFDNLVSSSFYWCKFRCKASFKWDDWLKNPYIVLV